MKEKLEPIMFVGTGSDVGKSIVATGFCRIFKQDGYCPAPFKAQNMSLNSYATPDNLEIGRAQAVQAQAAMIECCTDMNPLLLKPNSNHSSQVVLNGKPRGNCSAYDYFRKEGREELREQVHAAFDRLSAKYNPIVIEGAGSVSEINLRETDLVNMPMAIYAKANVILVADIERGGVFASVYGSIMLMTEQERERVKGIIINKFRGDVRLFEPGIKIIEDLCKVPVIGVLPYFSDIHIEEEDSMALKNKNFKSLNWQDGAVVNKVNIAVILLRHISNFTDFNVLETDQRVHLYYTRSEVEINNADIIIIPGSKSTIDDLDELKKSGLGKCIINARKSGKTIFGICGGYQIMGEMVYDPFNIEGETEQMAGLGLLPVTTTISREKRTVSLNFRLNEAIRQGQESSEKLSFNNAGYEIHMGETCFVQNSAAKALNILENYSLEGCFVDNKCMGTYLHGILDNKECIDLLLEPFKESFNANSFNYKDFKNEQYDKLAEQIRQYCNIDLVYKIIKGDN